MRRCPRCFSVYDDGTARCGPCGAATEPYSERRDAPADRPTAPEPSGGGSDEAEADAIEAEEAEDTGEVVLAEADPDWAERAMEALSRAGVSAQALLSEEEPPVVALVVQAADHERAIEVIGAALDEPPAVARRAGASPAGEAPEAGIGAEETVLDAPEPEPPPVDRPPRPLDPDQAALCPECGEAYRAGFERCADCDVPLVPADTGRGA